MNKLQILVTTTKMNHEQMVLLYHSMNIRTSAIIRSQCGRDSIHEHLIGDKIVITIETSDTGLSINRNELLKKATSDYIIFADDDFYFLDGYEEAFCDALKLCGQKEVLRFNVAIDSIRRYPKIMKNNKPVSKRTSYNGGIGFFVFSRKMLLSNKIWYKSYLGSGTSLLCGEDSVFIKELYDAKIIPVSVNKELMRIGASSDSWYKGATKQYIFARGAVYYVLHPFLYSLYFIRLIYKYRKDLKKNGVSRPLKVMFEGKKEIMLAKKTKRNPTYFEYEKKSKSDEAKILVIGNNCLSLGDSNGRTMMNLLSAFRTKSLANFYISNESPKAQLANSFFRITDKDVIKSFSLKIPGKVMENDNKSVVLNHTAFKKPNKNAFKYLIRNFLWTHSRWNSHLLNDWLNDFKPDLICLQIGDSPFMIKIARVISKERKIPLLIYNSEDYYFKNYNYLDRENHKKSLSYKMFYKKLKTEYESIDKNATWVHLTEPLKDLYDAGLKTNSSYVIMNSTNNEAIQYREVRCRFNAFYFGNLFLGRHLLLIEIADKLLNIDENNKLFIYGNASKEIIDAFSKHKNICYCGYANYDELMDSVKKKADLVIHVESHKPNDIRDLKHAFSTKIPDCLGLGIPFMIYASKEYCFVDYLYKNNACFVAYDNVSLENELRRIVINKDDYRTKYIFNAVRIANSNHNKEISANNFFDIVNSIVFY